MRQYAGWMRFNREDHGGTLVEFALSASILLASMFGIVDFSRALYAYHFVSHAAQEGARYAMVRGNDWTSGACASATSYGCSVSTSNKGLIQTFVQGLAMPGIVSSSVTATPSWPGKNADGTTTGCTTVNSQGCLVKVTVTYPFKFAILPLASISLSATSEQVIAY